MSEHLVVYKAYVYTYVKVDAQDELDAIQKADEKISQTSMEICFQCSYPDQAGFRNVGPISRDWPEVMEVSEVEKDGKIVWTEKANEHL